jgi:hypothetical protein
MRRKKLKRNQAHTWMLAALAAVALVTSLPGDAHAWEFESCSSKIESEVDLSTPQAMIMLDRSGSMLYAPNRSGDDRYKYSWYYNVWESGRVGWWFFRDDDFYSTPWRDPKSGWVCGTNNVCYSNFVGQPVGTEPSWGESYYGYWDRQHSYETPHDTLWSIAVDKIGEVTASYDNGASPKVNFGLGTFSNYYAPWAPAPSLNWGRIWSEASAYTDSGSMMASMEHIQQGAAIGGTPTAAAIKKMANSSTVSNQNTSNAGILITDGEPNVYMENGAAKGDTDGARNAAIREACAHRDIAPMYVIGFSSGTDKEFNDLLAAAGGTGSCTHANGSAADPCNMNAVDARNDLTCDGSFQADNGNDLKNALDTIADTIACTYPLDILGTPEGKAPSDPEGTRVHLGQCVPAPGTHTFMGDEFDDSRSDGSTASWAQLGLACTDICGATYSGRERLTYDIPTTPGVPNTVRIRLADYLHNCQDTLSIRVDADNQEIGTWSGSGINEWQVVEFTFTPSASQTFITIHQANDAYCAQNCDGTCADVANDLNMYVDWVKMFDPEAGCEEGTAISYVPPGSSGSGWTYAEDRTKVKLVGNACGEVKARQHDQVITQVACPCEQATGGTCKTDSGAACPTGRWECTAQWQDECIPEDTCDNNCAPRTSHDVGIGTPRVQVVMDNSGSMGSSISGDSRSKHNIARDVLADLADWSYDGFGCASDGSNCDRLHLGVHFWSSGKNTARSAQEDTDGNRIKQIFNNHWPSGGTYFHKAAELLRDENALNSPSNPNFGLMVTDGAPSGTSTVVSNIGITCDLRDRATAPVGTFVLGFGGNNAEQINSMVAAAGGTGNCCEGSGCDVNDPAQQLDPCSLKGQPGANGSLHDLVRSLRYNDFDSGDDNRYDVPVTCEGNIPATNAAALKSRLLNLFEGLECAYPLELLPDMTSAPENPVGTHVDVHLSNGAGLVSVPHIDDSAGQQDFVDRLNSKGVANPSDFADDGWSFGNQGRTYVELSPDLCSMVGQGDINQVDTQVCDACTQTGESCVAPCDGTEPYCDDEGFKVGRCREGIYRCIDDEDVCKSLRSPMPEICNGVDDSCDAQIDNLSDNEDEWSESQYDISSEYNGQYDGWYCGNRNACLCPTGNPDSIGGTVDDADEFQSMLDHQQQNGECVCGEGMTQNRDGRLYEPTSSPPPEASSGAACAVASPHRGADSPWLAFAFGVVVASLSMFRRRRS